MTGALAEACGELTHRWPAALALLAVPDTDGTAHGGKPGSRPPWNAQVANAVMDAHALVRRWDAVLFLEVTGRPRRPRGGSDGNTLAAIAAIANLGATASRATIADAERGILSSVTVIQQLAAFDEVPRWERLRAGPEGIPPSCPFCACFTLRVAVRSGMVICVLPGCVDGDGNPPRGRMEVGRVSSQPQVCWADGTVVSAP